MQNYIKDVSDVMAKNMFNPTNLAGRHNKLKEYYESILTEKDKVLALKDSHSKRLPRHCGITIHFTIGCPFQCSYCYIYDMGFPTKPRPYPLTPKQLVYAILNNPNFISGRYGTLMAIGAVSEPFIFQKQAQEYLIELSKLGNPIQFSTKAILSKNLISTISKLNAPVSPLITIVTLENWELLEPYAPDPYSRLDNIELLSSYGLKPCVFIRPIIAGINDNEVERIMKEAKDSGARCVVIGSFRITYGIYKRFKDLGLNTSNIEQRIRISILKRNPNKQFTVPLSQKRKNELINYARNLGLMPFKTACCANSYSAGVVCPSICFETGYCTACTNRCWEKPKPSLDEVEVALKTLGIKSIKLRETDNKLRINKRKYRWLIQTLSRRLVM